jgi:oxygen-independent coproporphyrinogen-3 oxidase
MAGIYIHIPFCRRACHYCDFHFTTNLNRSTVLVDAIVSEIGLRSDYLMGEPVKTIYFGGGTPSLLPTTDIARILDAIHRTQSVETEIEITLEANPEDLSSEKLLELRSIGVNRLSLGTQSFIDSELQWMNRMHSANQAERCIQEAQQIGFNNISIDLIFGLPEQTESEWELNLKKSIELNIQHISSYSLTIEPKTVLNHRIKKGEQLAPDESASARFFEINMQFFPAHGFEQYEISNFAKEGYISQHNSSYWKGAYYLGVGPSAHSFNGTSRQCNLRSNAAYINKINQRQDFFVLETLSNSNKVNEHIMTGLRTKWGVQKEVLDSIDLNAWDTVLKSSHGIGPDQLHVDDRIISLTDQGKLQADLIASELFI